MKLINESGKSRVCGRRFALARSQCAPLRTSKSRLDRQTFSKADASSFLSYVPPEQSVRC